MPNVTANFTMGALPPSFQSNPQALANLIAAGLTVDLDLDAVVLTGQVGGLEPVTNVGIWLPPVTGSTTAPSGIIYAWNSTSARYLPAPLVAGQLVASSVHITQIQTTATTDRIAKLPDKNGTFAFLDDISTGIGTKTLSGGSVSVNWEDQKAAYITLTSNATISLTGTPTDDQWQDLWIENVATSYTVTYAGTVIWSGGAAPTQTTASAGERRIDHIRLHHIGAGTGTIFGEVCAQDYQIATAADAGKPTKVTVTRYGNTVTLTMSELIQGGTLDASRFKVRTPLAGTLQTVSAVTAAGSIISIVMAAAMPSATEYSFEYSGTDIKDLTGNAADTMAEVIVPYVNVTGTVGGTGGTGGGHNDP